MRFVSGPSSRLIALTTHPLFTVAYFVIICLVALRVSLSGFRVAIIYASDVSTFFFSGERRIFAAVRADADLRYGQHRKQKFGIKSPHRSLEESRRCIISGGEAVSFGSSATAYFLSAKCSIDRSFSLSFGNQR